MSSITGIVPLLPLTPVKQISSTDNLNLTDSLNLKDGVQKAGTDFAQFLNDELRKVDDLQKNADLASIELATGQTQDLHTVMIALEKASLSLALTVEVRNKVLDAYNQIMRMQI